ncbi:unnamed protein product [Echinostoma caproni]|uniref:Vps4_C domain-containing protein n=1 Tax=Echinostoma caproni TaxID=27848 RepID=A0A183BAB0_9TREM|nr:unnamed protein product [Echinostoma caproni]
MGHSSVIIFVAVVTKAIAIRPSQVDDYHDRLVSIPFPMGILKSENDDPAKDPQFVEPLVDQARKLKDTDFEQTQRQNERRMRELLQQATTDGILIA